DDTEPCTPGPVTRMAERLAETIVGQDPMQAERIWWDLHAMSVRHTGGLAWKAMAGIDSALWDIRGKVLGAPVWQLLGGKLRDEFRLYWSHCGSTRANRAERLGVPNVETTDDLRALAAEVRERGYTALKTNLFRLKDRPDAVPASTSAGLAAGDLDGPSLRNAEA